MVSFYGFYTTYAFILTILCGASLGLILEKYDTTADSSCNVQEYKLDYNLKYLMMFLLISTIGINLLHIIGFFSTRETESSVCRKFIIFIMIVVYMVQCIASFTMIDKFKNNHSCFTFYEDSNLCMLISFIGICVVYIVQALIILIALLTKLCCRERDDSYKNFYP